jgi:hypothetical protein
MIEEFLFAPFMGTLHVTRLLPLSCPKILNHFFFIYGIGYILKKIVEGGNSGCFCVFCGGVRGILLSGSMYDRECCSNFMFLKLCHHC